MTSTVETRIVNDAALVLVGNELLSGKVKDENLVELARTLRALGIGLARVLVVPDEIDSLAADIARLSSMHDLVITSGGVGPTHDDLTIPAIARAFGLEVVQNELMEQRIREAYGERCTPSHLLMARVPEGAWLAATREVEWPVVVTRNVWALPGVPQIFRTKLLVLRAYVSGPGAIVSRSVATRLDEPLLKPALDEVVARFAGVDIGSYPKWFDPSCRTLITFDSRDSAQVNAAVGAFLALVPAADVVRVD